MVRKAIIETPITRYTTYTGGFKIAIERFNKTHPHESAGKINIQGVVKEWYIEKGKIHFLE